MRIWSLIELRILEDGSIICPSNRAALYGIKPTVGLASRAGIVPISSTQDSESDPFLNSSCILTRISPAPGPMAKSAFDAALVLSIIAGFDPRDIASTSSRC